MNRLEFITHFDKEILVNYFNQDRIINQTPQHITHTNVTELLQLIFDNYPEIDRNVEFSTYEAPMMGYCYIDEFDTNQYYKNNVICLEFEAFYPTVYFVNFINNTIDYNENIYLLYSLLHNFRFYCKVNHPDLYKNFRVFFHSFFGYIASRKYIKEHYPYKVLLDICSNLQKYFLYADMDTIYLKNVNYEKIENLISTFITSNIPYTITPIKYFYIEGNKKYASYYKENNEYKFVVKGIRKEEQISKIKKNFLSDFRIEKIEKLIK